MSSNDGRIHGVAIVGGGCSGLLVAVHLRRNGFRGCVTVIEPREQLGFGLAYSTPFDQHLLNVPAGKMSALAGEPAHFLEWLRANRCADAAADSFAPRKIYGEYLRDLLRETVSASGQARFIHTRAEVLSVGIEEGLPRLMLSDGSTIYADKIVLALGNPASSSEPERFGGGMEGRWYSSPWFDEALHLRFPTERILILGAGLTGVDSVLALGHQSASCEIVMLSRRGVLPQVHDLRGTAVQSPTVLRGGNLRLITREVRSNIEAARKAGLSWRAVLDALRADSNNIWRSLSPEDKRRFFRHLKTHWEPHRHRMPPEIRARLDDYRASGTLRIVAGRVRTVHVHGDLMTVGIRLKRGGEKEFHVHRIINCTGLHEDYAGTPRPLIRCLIEHGLARANGTGLGFETGEHGELRGDNLKQPSLLFTLGPPRRGELFETTAVPEIRVQAEELARHLVRLMSSGPPQAGRGNQVE